MPPPPLVLLPVPPPAPAVLARMVLVCLCALVIYRGQPPAFPAPGLPLRMPLCRLPRLWW